MYQPAYQIQQTACGQTDRAAPLTVLVIDDDPAYRYLCVCALQEATDADYVTIEAGSAGEALEQMRSHRVDCALVDYRLPDATGADLIDMIRTEIPDWLGSIIVMTSGGSEEVAAEILRAGASDYIPKQQVSPQCLRRAIHNATEKASLYRAIRRRSLQVSEANEKLQQRNREITQFYHRVSH